jgi:glutathione synthase/RimK-type ligase-like ATP-grasp enzyme
MFPKRIIEYLIEEIAAAHGWQCRTLADGWIVEVSNKASTTLVCGYSFDINPAGAAEIACDKAACSELLAAHGLPVLRHRLHSHYLPVTDVFAQIDTYRPEDFPLVVKPAQGHSGRGIELVTNKDELTRAVIELRKIEQSAAVSKKVDIASEYRTIMLDGEGLIHFEKKLPRHTSGPLPLHNLGLGATAEEIHDEKLINTLNEMTHNAMQALGLRFASIDIIAIDGKFMILEVNRGVTMEKYAEMSELHREKAKRVYEKALVKALDK